MRVRTIAVVTTPRGEIPPGKIITIPDEVLDRLKGKVEPLRAVTVDGNAWLTLTGELRSSKPSADLAETICELTEDNLELQRKLLLRHCESFDRHHLPHLWELWAERAAIRQFDGGLDREESEHEAAKELHLLSFMP
jgi:hypothetical protein